MEKQSFDELLTTADVVALVRLSRTDIWRRRRAGEFPEPYDVGKGRLRWRRDELEEWVRRLPRFNAVRLGADRARGKRPGAQS